MKPGDLVRFPDEDMYFLRGKLFLVLENRLWESPHNGRIFKEVLVLEAGNENTHIIREDCLLVVR